MFGYGKTKEQEMETFSGNASENEKGKHFRSTFSFFCSVP